MTNKLCEYNFNNCQKTAEFQHFQQLGGITLTKGTWTCLNCKQIIEKIQHQKSYD